MKIFISICAVLAFLTISGLGAPVPPPPAPTNGLAEALRYIDSRLPWTEIEALFEVIKKDPQANTVISTLTESLIEHLA
jgi:hypothetical protein